MMPEKSNVKFTTEETKTIKKKLIDLDLSYTDISKEIGVSARSVTCVVNGQTTSLRIRNYLAKRLNLPEFKIIPSYLYLD